MVGAPNLIHLKNSSFKMCELFLKGTFFNIGEKRERG